MSSEAAPLLQQIELLSRENALLRAKIEKPEAERLLQDAVVGELHEWIEKAVSELPTKSEFSGFVGEGSNASALVALEEICKKNEILDHTISELQRDVIIPLRDQNKAFETQCEELRLENLKLTTNESLQTKLLTSELIEAREIQKRLIGDLAEIRNNCADEKTVVSDALDTVRSSVGDVAKLTADKRQLEALVDTLTRKNELLPELIRLSYENAISDLEANLQHEKQLVSELRASLDEVRASSEFHIRKAFDLEHRVLDLEKQLSDRHEAKENLDLPEFREMKKRRLETDRLAFGDGVNEFERAKSMRVQMLNFWYDGHERIESLEKQVEEVAHLRESLKAAKREIASFAASRQSSVECVTALTQEVERLREEAVQLRSGSIALKSENGAIVAQLAAFLATEMDEEAIRDCAASIRESARRAAVANFQAAVDTKEMEKVLRQAQEMKHEISQLSKQKDRLQRVIALRETRLLSLNRTLGAQENRCALEHGDSSCEGSLVVANCDDQVAFSGDHHIDQEKTRLAETAMVLSHERDSLKERISQLEQEVEETLKKHVLSLEASSAHCSELQEHVRQLTASSSLALVYSDESKAVVQAMSKLVNSSLHVIHRQLSLLQNLYEENEQLRATARQAEESASTRALPPSDNDIQVLSSALQQQLEEIKDTAAAENRRHSIQETKFVLALIDDLKTREQKLESLREKFLDTLKSQPETLSRSIGAVRQQWEKKLESALVAAQTEKHSMEAQLASDKGILSNIECSMRMLGEQARPEQKGASNEEGVFASRLRVVEEISEKISRVEKM